MTSRPVTAGLEEQLELALRQVAELREQIERASALDTERDAQLRALRDAWQTVDGRTLRHEAGVESVRALAAAVSALEERLEQESQLRRDALVALGQGVARDRDATGAVVEQLEELESRFDETARTSAGAGVQRQTQAGALRELEHRLDRMQDALGGLELRVAAEREASLGATSERGALESRVAALTLALGEHDVRTREAQNERRVLADAVAELQTAGRQDVELRELLDQQRATRQRLEERLMTLEDGWREVGRALLEAAEQRAQLRLQVGQLATRLEELAARQDAERELLVGRLRALAGLEDRAGQRHVAELERRARERREVLSRLDELTEQATKGMPL